MYHYWWFFFGYLWFPCSGTMPAYRQMCAVLEGLLSVALCLDTKKTFTRWQKAGFQGYVFCPSSPHDHYREIRDNFHVDRLVEYSLPRLQDPSVLHGGNWGGGWRQPASPGYTAIFQGCHTLVLGMPSSPRRSSFGWWDPPLLDHHSPEEQVSR